MSSIEVFHRIFSADVIERDVVACLQKWYPTYLRELAHQNGIVEELASPRKYTSRNKFDSLPGEDQPKVVVISPGLASAPQMSGNGQYRATWRLGIGIALSAESEDTANQYSKIYGAAARAIMLQQAGKDTGYKITWLDENFVDLPIEDQIMQYRAAALYFAIDVENVVTKRGGPALPDQDPYSYGLVETIDIDLEKVGQNESV